MSRCWSAPGYPMILSGLPISALTALIPLPISVVDVVGRKQTRCLRRLIPQTQQAQLCTTGPLTCRPNAQPSQTINLAVSCVGINPRGKTEDDVEPVWRFEQEQKKWPAENVAVDRASRIGKKIRQGVERVWSRRASVSIPRRSDIEGLRFPVNL